MRASGGVNFIQLISGVFFLLAGITIYLLIRGNALPYLPEAWVVSEFLPYRITQLTHQLPTFTHLIAFSLFTAALLDGGRRNAALVCLFWLFIAIIFEVAQHPIVSGWLVPSVPQWFDKLWLLDNTRGFLVNGTFDPLDIVAAVLAALLTYLIINFTQAQRIILNINASQHVAMELERSLP